MKSTFSLLLLLAIATVSTAQTSRVGIGTTTPAIPLDVAGDTIGLRNRISSWDNLWFHTNGSSANITASGADSGLRFRVGRNISGNYGNGQSFNTAMTLLPNGSIGIGTTTPTPFSQMSNTTKNTLGADGNGGNSGSLSWAVNQGGYAVQIFNGSATGFSNGLAVKVSGTTRSMTAFDVSSGPQDTLGRSLFTVKADGFVGIGTPNPLTRLDVITGSARLGMRVTGGRGQEGNLGILILQDSSNNTSTASSNILEAFLNAQNGLIGGIGRETNGNTIIYGTTSDIRLKTGIRPTHYGLSDLMAIEVADYQYKGYPNAALQTGFLAQQLYRIFPQAVAKGNDADEKQPYMVDYGKLTPLLVKAVQELKAQVDTLQKENEALKAAASSSLDGRVKKIEALMQKLGMTDAGL